MASLAAAGVARAKMERGRKRDPKRVKEERREKPRQKYCQSLAADGRSLFLAFAFSFALSFSRASASNAAAAADSAAAGARQAPKERINSAEEELRENGEREKERE